MRREDVVTMLSDADITVDSIAAEMLSHEEVDDNLLDEEVDEVALTVLNHIITKLTDEQG